MRSRSDTLRYLSSFKHVGFEHIRPLAGARCTQFLKGDHRESSRDGLEVFGGEEGERVIGFEGAGENTQGLGDILIPDCGVTLLSPRELDQ